MCQTVKSLVFKLFVLGLFFAVYVFNHNPALSNLRNDCSYKVGPNSYKWTYNNLCKWPYQWVTGVITPISGVIT